MSVKTTINIHKKIMDQIEIAADKSGKSRSEIIALLLMQVMLKDTSGVPSSGPVKYQDKDSKEMWYKFHISLREDEYEYFTDLRNVLKKSVSLLVAYAVKKYLYEILFGKKSDIYHFQNYIIEKEDANGVICWKIFWGIPKNMEQFM